MSKQILDNEYKCSIMKLKYVLKNHFKYILLLLFFNSYISLANAIQFDIVELGTIEKYDSADGVMLSDNGLALVRYKDFFVYDIRKEEMAHGKASQIRPTGISKYGLLYGIESRDKAVFLCWWDRHFNKIYEDVIGTSRKQCSVKPSLSEYVLGNVEKDVFISSPGRIEFLPLEQLFQDMDINARWGTLTTNDSGNVVGTFCRGELHPRKNKLLYSAIDELFYWDGRKIHIIGKHPLCDYHHLNVAGIDSAGRVLFEGGAYDDLDREKWIRHFSAWSSDNGWTMIVCCGTCDSLFSTPHAVDTTSLGIVFYGSDGLRIMEPQGSCSKLRELKLRDLEKMSDFNRIYPDGNISRITHVNHRGQLLVQARLWGESHPLVLTPIQ